MLTRVRRLGGPSASTAHLGRAGCRRALRCLVCFCIDVPGFVFLTRLGTGADLRWANVKTTTQHSVSFAIFQRVFVLIAPGSCATRRKVGFCCREWAFVVVHKPSWLQRRFETGALVAVFSGQSFETAETLISSAFQLVPKRGEQWSGLSGYRRPSRFPPATHPRYSIAFAKIRTFDLQRQAENLQQKGKSLNGSQRQLGS